MRVGIDHEVRRAAEMRELPRAGEGSSRQSSRQCGSVALTSPPEQTSCETPGCLPTRPWSTSFRCPARRTAPLRERRHTDGRTAPDRTRRSTPRWKAGRRCAISHVLPRSSETATPTPHPATAMRLAAPGSNAMSEMLRPDSEIPHALEGDAAIGRDEQSAALRRRHPVACVVRRLLDVQYLESGGARRGATSCRRPRCGRFPLRCPPPDSRSCANPRESPWCISGAVRRSRPPRWRRHHG